MNCKIVYIVSFLFVILFNSCIEKRKLSYSLKSTNEELSFILDNNTKSSIMTMFVYNDNEFEYLTFQNPSNLLYTLRQLKNDLIYKLTEL